MQITRTSMLTNVNRTLDIDVTNEQLSRWENGELIQLAMPHLSSSDREFIMTGIVDEEWDILVEEDA